MEGWGDAEGSWQQGPCYGGADTGSSLSGGILGSNQVSGFYDIVPSAMCPQLYKKRVRNVNFMTEGL